MPFPEQELCDFFFRVRIYANLQQFAAHGWDMKPVAENPTIQHIFITAKPQTFYLKTVRSLLCRRKYGMLRMFLIMIMFVKRNLKK